MRLTDLLSIPRNYKNLQRAREILSVIARYGWGDVVARLPLDNPLQRGRRRLESRRRAPAVEAYTTEQRIRMALEELGPTFVKLGQLMATRPDLVPLSLVEELRKLQDAVAPFSSADARRKIEQELGRSIDELFSSFDETPLAAASIAQVHRATLANGRAVVVKIRRPRITETIERDLDILSGLAALIEEHVHESAHYSPRAIVDEFARAIRKEIDFHHEASNLRRFARNFADDARVRVPEVHADHSEHGVLTTDLMEGSKATDLAALDAAGIDRSELARLGIEVVLEQVFVHGFFHADPHPGNVFIQPGPTIAFIDMGMMGHLDSEMIDSLLELLVGILLHDVDKIARLFVKQGLVEPDLVLAPLRRDLSELLDDFVALPIAELDISTLMTRLFDTLNRHRVRVPPELLLMAKALATVEGMARELDPHMNPIEAMRPFLLKRYLERLSDPRFIARDWLEAAREGTLLLQSAPRELRQLLGDLSRGALQVRVRIESLEHATRERSRDANRRALAMVVAAGLVASALLAGQAGGPVVLGLRLSALLALAGFALSGFGLSALAFGFLRSGRF